MLSDVYGKPVSGHIEPYKEIDELFQSLKKDGNAYVRFRGFDPGDPVHEGFMTRVYFRGSYIAYPKRIYVSSDRAVINEGPDIVGSNRDPTAGQIVRNQIKYLVIFEIDRDTGRLKYKIQSVTRSLN